jgi:Ca2+-binding EF-hand superfamily protein
MKEFKAIMLHNFQIAEKDVVNIFQAIDANHDDEIHYSEFLAAMLSTRIKVNDKLVDSTFRNFDKDLSGYITADNLRDAFGNAFEGQGVEHLLQEADVSRDGRISYPEFAAYVRGTPVQQNGPRLSYVPRKPSRNLQNTAKRTEVEGVQQPCCSIM